MLKIHPVSWRTNTTSLTHAAVEAQAGTVLLLAAGLHAVHTVCMNLLRELQVYGLGLRSTYLYMWSAGVRHSIGGADYASVRAGAFMGLRIMNHLQAEQGLEPLGQLLYYCAYVFLLVFGLHQGMPIGLRALKLTTGRCSHCSKVTRNLSY